MEASFIGKASRARCVPASSRSAFIYRNLHEVEIRIAHIDRAYRADRAGLLHRALDDFDVLRLQLADHCIERHSCDEAQIERSRHGDMRFRLALAPPLMQVDLLLAEAEREPLHRRRLEGRELHP